jgi:phosphate butyryltransferase
MMNTKSLIKNKDPKPKKMQISKLDQMFDVLATRPKKRMIAAWGVDSHTILAAYMAVEKELIEATLVGDEKKILSVCKEHNLDCSKFNIVHCPVDIKSASLAVEMINKGKGDFLMKGLISTDRYMKAILNKECGLMDPGAILSHVTVTESKHYHKLLIVGDVAIIPLPDLNQKIAITNYLIRTANLLGIENPKVGLLSPVNKPFPKLLLLRMPQLLPIWLNAVKLVAIEEGPLGLRYDS